MLLLDAIHGIFGPILKLSRSITLHLYNDSVPGLESRCRVGYRFFFSFSLFRPTPFLRLVIWYGMGLNHFKMMKYVKRLPVNKG